MDKHYNHIVSIKGVGLVNAAALIALTADFMKFPLDALKEPTARAVACATCHDHYTMVALG